MIKPQPWSPADATRYIRELGKQPKNLSYSDHFTSRLLERDLLIGDVLYVLRNGFVYEEAVPATQANLYKYKIETRTPNSHNRQVRVVVIPDYGRCWIKVVTVMWVDE